MIAVAAGMVSERNLVGLRPGVVICVGAGNAAGLAARLEAAIVAGCTHVISIGVVGALDPSLPSGAIVVGTRAIGGETVIPTDPDWTARLWSAINSRLEPLPCPVSLAKFAWSNSDSESKPALRAATGADVVDQETFIAAQIARAHGLPFGALRAVLDPASFALPPAARLSLTASGGVNLEAVLASLASNPEQLPDLAQLETFSTLAFEGLEQALARVGDSFCAYPLELDGA